MKYASELSAEGTLSIANWRPIQPDRFLSALHGFACDYSDVHGNAGIRTTKSMKVDRRATATIYYIPKHGDHEINIYSPVLLTLVTRNLTGDSEKMLCFEFIQPDDGSASALEKRPAKPQR